ncbi:MAG: carbohydrate ABC transporter permease [Sphaerochaetaceae bacterium]|jgi:multiple sugar transport system permease protein/raffinose/stachyose/melibiose transport system permease protein|nr:carbohydrate ABC transporter permease [Spirochaetaceae bacterium]MDY6342925.1 carbohydrate ABC transporter permease [Sphaerochaetaceae bacterium]
MAHSNSVYKREKLVLDMLKRLAELLLIVIWLFPLVWLVITSLKTEGEVVTKVFTFLPVHPTLYNYTKAFTSTYILNWLGNSLFVSLVTMVLTILVDAPVAYAFAKIHFKGSTALFWMVMAGMMVPFQVLIVPLYLQFNAYGLVDTLTGALLPRLAMPIGIFILKQFFEEIPDALEEAAFIDGACRFSIFRRVILPLGKAAITTVIILSFINAWNDFLWPLIIINDTIKYTITVGIANFQGTNGTEYALIMAGAAIASLPQIVFFLAFRRQIIEGIAMSGIKG